MNQLSLTGNSHPVLKAWMAQYLKDEKITLSICAVTGLDKGAVLEITGGRHRDIVLKAAALTGECMAYEEAARRVLVHHLDLKPAAKASNITMINSATS